MNYLNQILEDENGDAIVEATFVFPIIIFIIMGLIILSMYLPTKGVLQYATQRAANAVSVEMSDTWIKFNENEMKFESYANYEELNNVYVDAAGSIFSNGNSVQEKAIYIVNKLYDDSIALKAGSDLDVDVKFNNAIIYKEVVVTAEKIIPSPINLSIVGFPSEIKIQVSSTAVVQNGDEMVRNLDIVKEVVVNVNERYKISEKFENVATFLKK